MRNLRCGSDQMTEEAREKDAAAKASSSAQRWAARRREVEAAIESDQRRILQARMEKAYQARADYQGSLAFIVGALVVFVLLSACWFLMDRMRCDPFYANVDRFSSRTCR